MAPNHNLTMHNTLSSPIIISLSSAYKTIMKLIYPLFILIIAIAAPSTCQENAEEWLERGNELFSQGDYEEAIEAYDEALRLDPENPVAWSNKGTALINQRRYEEAIQAFDEVIRIDPELASAWSYKGGALHELGEYDEAIVALDQAIGLEPENGSIWSLKGSALYFQGETMRPSLRLKRP